MRVVAGELRGRRLAAPPKRADVRPTADRVRESLFAILGDVSGARVLDLFAGTGALAIEALSRGAAGATLVDSDTALASRNVEALGLSDRARVVRADARSFMRRERATFELVFCDPPYTLADRLGPELDKSLPPLLAPGARVITESAARKPLELALPLADERRYGETLIRIHTAPGAAAR
ncbi:MAG TPA: RsmD family RNA methyltransferase [Solirubrobacterales bacterium]